MLRLWMMYAPAEKRLGAQGIQRLGGDLHNMG